MTGEVDPFPFRLAHDLGMTIADLEARMPQAEWVRWRAWYVYRDAMEEWGRR